VRYNFNWKQRLEPGVAILKEEQCSLDVGRNAVRKGNLEQNQEAFEDRSRLDPGERPTTTTAHARLQFRIVSQRTLAMMLSKGTQVAGSAVM
jgi:hypothetical protein